MDKNELDRLLSGFSIVKPVTPREIKIDQTTSLLWVRFKVDPSRFVPTIFDGDWAFTQQHPTEGSAKLLRALEGSDGISRLIIRQGKYLYAYPWFE